MQQRDTHQPPYWVGIRVLTCNTKKQNIITHWHSQSTVNSHTPSLQYPNTVSLTRTRYFDSNHWSL